MILNMGAVNRRLTVSELDEERARVGGSELEPPA
jgi:hypothetical protein